MIKLQTALSTHPTLRQFATYVVVGGLGTSVHYTILMTLVNKFQCPAVAASATGFVGGAIVNYYLNYYWTFRSRKNIRQTFYKFFIIAMGGLVLNTSLMAAFTLISSFHYLVAQVLATALVTGITYFGNRHWTFMEVSP